MARAPVGPGLLKKVYRQIKGGGLITRERNSSPPIAVAIVSVVAPITIIDIAAASPTEAVDVLKGL